MIPHPPPLLLMIILINVSTSISHFNMFIFDAVLSLPFTNAGSTPRQFILDLGGHIIGRTSDVGVPADNNIGQ